MLMALVFIFLAGAVIPGYKAFSISLKNGNIPGTTEDSNFWNLVQSSIMSVMANVVTVVPHLRKSWLSPVYTLVWFFFLCGLVFSLLAIGLYPVCNPAWSSVSSFLGAIASTASVLVFTQVTSRDEKNGIHINKGGSGKEKIE